MEAEDWKAKDLENGDSKAEDLGNEYSVSNFGELMGNSKGRRLVFQVFNILSYVLDPVILRTLREGSLASPV